MPILQPISFFLFNLACTIKQDNFDESNIIKNSFLTKCADSQYLIVIIQVIFKYYSFKQYFYRFCYSSSRSTSTSCKIRREQHNAIFTVLNFVLTFFFWHFFRLVRLQLPLLRINQQPLQFCRQNEESTRCIAVFYL